MTIFRFTHFLAAHHFHLQPSLILLALVLVLLHLLLRLPHLLLEHVEKSALHLRRHTGQSRTPTCHVKTPRIGRSHCRASERGYGDDDNDARTGPSSFPRGCGRRGSECCTARREDAIVGAAGVCGVDRCVCARARAGQRDRKEFRRSHPELSCTDDHWLLLLLAAAAVDWSARWPPPVVARVRAASFRASSSPSGGPAPRAKGRRVPVEILSLPDRPRASEQRRPRLYAPRASPVSPHSTAAQIARRAYVPEYRYADRRVATRKAPEIPRPSRARPTVRIALTRSCLVPRSSFFTFLCLLYD